LKPRKDIPENYYVILSDNNPVTIHAKFLEGMDKEGKKFTLLGSANYTQQAFEGNFECDIKFRYDECTIPKPEYDQEAKNLNGVFGIDGKKIVIRKLKEDNVYSKLEKESERQSFVDKLQKLDWSVTLKEKELSIDARWTEDLFSKNEKKYLNNMEIVLPGKRLAIHIIDMKNGDKVFNFSCENYKKINIPWYGYLNLVYYETYNSPQYVPLKVELKHQLSSVVCQDVIEAEVVAKVMLSGKLFNLRNAIPAEPKVINKPPIYSSNDSVEIRQAKYLAKGGDIESIMNNVKMISGRFKLVEVDENDDFSEMQNISKETLEQLKQRYKHYYNILENER